nr:hypothetical protein [Tanacetum cinerariifolium]
GDRSFNELMDTPMDFSAFLINRLKVDTLTPELLAGPTYELMKGSCKRQQYPHNLLKPLSLIPNSRGRHVIPFDHFINNDLDYLRGGASSRKYTTFVTKTKAAFYGHIKWIEDLVPRTMRIQEPIVEWRNYKHLDWITMRRDDDKKADKSDNRRTLCFQRLSKKVHKKHRHPTAYGRSLTRCQKLPKEAQPHKTGYLSIRFDVQGSLHRLLQSKRTHLSEYKQAEQVDAD